MDLELIENTLSRIRGHLQNNYMSKSEIKFLEENFPSFIYEGECYRACRKNEDYYSSLYWSKSLTGVNSYIKNSYDDGSKEEFSIVKANIRGIDLNELLSFLNKQTPNKSPVINPYFEEEEVLALTVNLIY